MVEHILRLHQIGFRGPPRPFVKINNSSGIILAGNFYENEIPNSFAVAESGIGVQFTDSRVAINESCSSNNVPCSPQDIVRSEFKNLTVGVNGSNTGKDLRTLYCDYNIFTNNVFGVQLSNVNYAEILDNDFDVKPLSGASGIALTANTGYMVENNNFKTYNGGFNYGNYGIAIISSGKTPTKFTAIILQILLLVDMRRN